MTDEQDALANDIYAAVVRPDTIWWGDLTSDMQDDWRRGAAAAARWFSRQPLDIHVIASAMADFLTAEVVAGMLATRGISMTIAWPDLESMGADPIVTDRRVKDDPLIPPWEERRATAGDIRRLADPQDPAQAKVLEKIKDLPDDAVLYPDPIVTNVGPDRQDRAHELAQEHARKVADALGSPEQIDRTLDEF